VRCSSEMRGQLRVAGFLPGWLSVAGIFGVGVGLG
jgi:hypothetical protein